MKNPNYKTKNFTFSLQLFVEHQLTDQNFVGICETFVSHMFVPLQPETGSDSGDVWIEGVCVCVCGTAVTGETQNYEQQKICNVKFAQDSLGLVECELIATIVTN